ncbi:MAG: hypothetical protein WC082_00975 [Victivallales bacterium]
MAALKKHSPKKDERGIALVFTFMFLALLLIIALGFALSSMFDRKSAFNAANAAAAGILAQTQLKEIVSLIENDKANLEDSKLYSHDSGSPSVTNTDMLKDMLASRLPVSGLLDTVDTDKVNWNYIRSKDSGQEIIGRTAFVVIAGGIALDSLVDGRAGSTAYPKHSEEFDTETRIGKYVSEINVRAPMPSATSTICDALNWQGTTADSTVPGFDNGKYTGDWKSSSALVSTLETAIGSALSSTQKEELLGNLSIIVAKDEEAFWADLNDDAGIGLDELYKRFNLNRTDWDTLSIDGKMLLDSGSAGAPTQAMEKWTDTDSDAGSAGLPWLACFGYKDDGTGNGVPDESLKGTFNLTLDRRRQIAANLKDYCDTDDIPSSDVDPASWYGASTAPAYTGNEKTPYINKAGVKIVASSLSSGSSDYNTSGKVEIKPLVGLVNIYGTAWPDDLKVRITGSVTVACKIDGVVKILNTDPATATNSVIPFDTVIDVNGTDNASPNWPGSDGYSHFLEGAATAGTTLSVGPNAAAINVEINVTAINIDKIILYDATTNTKGYDYVKSLSVAGLPFTAISSSTGADDSKNSWYGLEVNDPRQNLNSGDWVQYSPSSVDAQHVFSLDASDDTVCKPNADSSNSPAAVSPARVAPKDGNDAEGTITDPANSQLSTAFIRNAPMESPWELGFIHRGAQWETINLKKYDTGKAYQTVTISGNKYILGGGAYSSGDANILDQIKMLSKAKSQRKINLHTQKSGVLEALFSKIKLKPTIDAAMSVNSIAGGSDTEMLAGVSTIIANIKAKFADDTTYPLNTKRTRASIVDKLLLPLGTTITADTDAGQEELVGKIVNLTKIGGNVDTFTAIIIAQTIKDVGTAAGVSMSKASADGTVKSRNCILSVFDADIDLANPDKSVYFDEITAEQKIIARGYRAVNGKVVISSFQYIE